MTSRRAGISAANRFQAVGQIKVYLRAQDGQIRVYLRVQGIRAVSRYQVSRQSRIRDYLRPDNRRKNKGTNSCRIYQVS